MTKNHYYSIYKKKGKKCPHVTTKYSNYLSTTHPASSKQCEVYLAIKATTTTMIPITPINK